MAQPQAFVRAGILHVPVLDAAAGEAVARQLAAMPGRVVIQQESYAASDRRWLESTLIKWCDEDELDLLLTIGGTLPAPGPSRAEIVPEATGAVVERLVPGLAEAMRADLREEYAGASLHRGITGIRGRTLIVNLPAGAKVAERFLEAILEELPYILSHLREDAAAVTLAQLLVDGAATVDEGVVTEEGATPPPAPRGKGLNAEEFAAFLRRKESRE